MSIHIVLAFLIVVFGYFVGRAYHARFDLSEGKIYSLSPQTLQVLDQLKGEPIRAHAFFTDDQPAREELRDLLKEYASHHPNFSYEFYDPDRMPLKAKQYRIDAYGTLVLEMKGQHEKTKRISEEAVTNLLIKLQSRPQRTAVFATGHGGPDVNDAKGQQGAGFFKTALLDAHYEVKEIVLLQDPLPEKTDILIFLGPQVDILPEELEVIKAYFEREGNVLMLLDPVDSGEGKNTENFLLSYGLRLGHDVVVDKVSKLFGADYLIPLVSEYKPHVITNDFRIASFFPIARSIRKAEPIPAGFQVEEIASTSAGSWAESDLKNLEEGKAEFKEGEDVKGPVPLAAVISREGAKGRFAVFGDSDFATNAYLGLSGNKDLLLNSVAWLSGDESTITIRPRARKSTPLYLKQSEQAFLFYVPVLGLPALFFVAGTAVFFARRRFA